MFRIFYIQCCILVFLVSVYWVKSEEKIASKTEKIILQRLELLQDVAKLDRTANKCNKDKLIIITEFPYGNSGNHLIEFTNGIWVADKLDATLVVPLWMQDVLNPFNLTLLSKYYCFTQDNEVSKTATKFEVTSEESFFLFMLQKSDQFSKLLPDLNAEKTITEISVHFLKVYAALWSSPIKDIFDSAVWLIDNHLKGDFGYTTGQ